MIGAAVVGVAASVSLGLTFASVCVDFFVARLCQ